MPNENKKTSTEVHLHHSLAASGEYTATTKWKVDTSIDWDTGIINQSVSTISGELVEWLLSTRDDQLRDALITLGWTPPQ
jgi:hypothetical protein